MKVYTIIALTGVLFAVGSVAGKPQQQNNDLAELERSSDLATSRDSSAQPHSRQKRTIGHIFDMFRKMMDSMFGGGKKGGKKGNRGRRPQRPGSAYGAPQAPSSGYGAPQSPSSGYGPPRRPSYGGGGGGQRPPPPPPRGRPNLSGGYAGGQPPPRPPVRAPNNNYGGPQFNAAPAGDSYGGPQFNSAPAGDSYGSPQAPTLNNNNLDSYGSPQAQPLSAGDSYGSPQAAPISNYGRGQGSSAPRAPSQEFGPGSAIKILPAPNLATAAPPSAPSNYGSPGLTPDTFAAPDSYGSPQAPALNSAPNVDSYGSPQAPTLNANSAPDSYGSPQAPAVGAPDSYGSPQANVLTPNSAPSSYGGPVSAPDSYGSPQQQQGGPIISINNAPAPSPNNPFIRQPQSNYGNSAAPLPVTPGNNNLVGNFIPNSNPAPAPNSYGAPAQSSYGSPAPAPAPAPGGYGAPAPLPQPIQDIDLPQNTPIVIEGRGQSGQRAQSIDAYGSPAPVGTSAPVPDEILNERAPDSYEGAPRRDSTPVGELTSTKVEGEDDSAPSPLFDDLRNVAFTSADDDEATEAVPRDPIEIDLTNNVVDLTNGLDQEEYKPEVDLTGDQDDESLADNNTTPVPDLTAGDRDEYTEYEDDDYYYDDEEYIGDEDTPPELPADLDLRDRDDPQPGYGDDDQESYESPDREAAADGTGDADDEYYYYDDEEYSDNLADARDTTPPSPTQEADQSFISVPLMIEEVTNNDVDIRDDGGDAPIILAGTEAAGPEKKPDTLYGAPGSGNSGDESLDLRQARTGKERGGRRAPHAFHQFLVEPPQAKRNADWSQRLVEKRRKRVWRQFNLD